MRDILKEYNYNLDLFLSSFVQSLILSWPNKKNRLMHENIVSSTYQRLKLSSFISPQNRYNKHSGY